MYPGRSAQLAKGVLSPVGRIAWRFTFKFRRPVLPQPSGSGDERMPAKSGVFLVHRLVEPRPLRQVNHRQRSGRHKVTGTNSASMIAALTSRCPSRKAVHRRRRQVALAQALWVKSQTPLSSGKFFAIRFGEHDARFSARPVACIATTANFVRTMRVAWTTRFATCTAAFVRYAEVM